MATHEAGVYEIRTGGWAGRIRIPDTKPRLMGPGRLGNADTPAGVVETVREALRDARIPRTQWNLGRVTDARRRIEAGNGDEVALEHLLALEANAEPLLVAPLRHDGVTLVPDFERIDDERRSGDILDYDALDGSDPLPAGEHALARSDHGNLTLLESFDAWTLAAPTGDLASATPPAGRLLRGPCTEITITRAATAPDVERRVRAPLMLPTRAHARGAPGEPAILIPEPARSEWRAWVRAAKGPRDNVADLDRWLVLRAVAALIDDPPPPDTGTHLDTLIDEWLDHLAEIDGAAPLIRYEVERSARQTRIIAVADRTADGDPLPQRRRGHPPQPSWTAWREPGGLRADRASAWRVCWAVV